MSKRQEIRGRRQRERTRNRIIVILLIAAGAFLVVYALVLPSINQANAAKKAGTQITPAAPHTSTAAQNGLHLGDPNAPVKIDTWEDFQCSACLSYTQTIVPQVIKDFVDTGKVYYTYHFFPLIDQGNPSGESHQAANAAMCANAQGRFWDYHDILFANWLGENVGSYTDARLTAMAQSIKLDMNQFATCFQANQYKAQIDQDEAAGKAKGVQGTPSVFVNGTILTPGYIPSYNDIAQAVNTALVGK
jgi:protein-disulfide isomerase